GDRPILMTVLNTMLDSVIILKDNIIFFANIPALKLFGYKYPRDIIGRDIVKHIESEEFSSVIEKHEKCVELKSRFEEKIINLEGDVSDVDINVSNIDVDLLMLTIRDISKRKILEKEKESNTDTIIKMKSNLKVTQEKLISQEHMAGIGQLATGIVHEIFNPLGFVMSNFSTLKTYFNDMTCMVDEINENDEITKEKIMEIENKYDIEFILSDIKDLFTDVEEGISRINGIILNLKKFSRQEVDEFIEYDINEGIQSTLVVAKNEYKYIADVETKLEDLPYTKANASKINQVLLNLIVNASYAIKDKNSDERGLIKINTFEQDNFIVCEVIDTGIGMNVEVYDQIFEPFYTTKPVGIGTGLGLSISYDIITKQHGGYISVESEKGKGSKFTIKIPIIEFEAE
ncbi:MAG: ATP-binding protein, partial [Acidaminobacteraceae bacterium]